MNTPISQSAFSIVRVVQERNQLTNLTERDLINNVIIDLLSLLNMVEIKAETADVTLSSLKNDVDKILTMLVPVKNDVDKIKTAFKELLERLDDLTL